MNNYVIQATFNSGTDCMAKTKGVHVRPITRTGACELTGSVMGAYSKTSCTMGAQFHRRTTTTHNAGDCSDAAQTTFGSDLDMCSGDETSMDLFTCWDETTMGTGSAYGMSAPSPAPAPAPGNGVAPGSYPSSAALSIAGAALISLVQRFTL